MTGVEKARVVKRNFVLEINFKSSRRAIRNHPRSSRRETTPIKLFNIKTGFSVCVCPRVRIAGGPTFFIVLKLKKDPGWLVSQVNEFCN